MSSQYFIFYIIAILIGIVLHEFAHAITAVALGDSTPRLQGRLSLNPLVHFEVVGLIMMLIAPIGWAKPVVCDPSQFRHPRLGMAITALAGPACNLLLACVGFGLLSVMWPNTSGFLPTLCLYVAEFNVNLCLFNLIPIPPLDGSRILALVLPASAWGLYRWLERYGSLVVLVLVVLFNRILLAPLFTDAQIWVAGWFGLR